MARRILKTNWNRKQLDDTNENFKELYKDVSVAIRDSSVAKSLNQLSFDTVDEIRTIAKDSDKKSTEAKDTSNEAETIAKDTNDRMNDIISGTTNEQEIIDARKPLGLEKTKTLNERLNMQFGKNDDFRPDDISIINKMKNEFADR